MFNFSLIKRICYDCFSGGFSAFLISPLLYIIDYSVVQKAAGVATVTESIKKSLRTLMFKPGQFFGRADYRWVAIVTISTYMTANSLDSITHHYKIGRGLGELTIVTTVNMILSLYRDVALAKLSGKTV